MTRPSHWLPMLGLLASALACTHPSPYPDQSPTSRTIRLGVRQLFVDFDPLRGGYFEDAQVSVLIFDGLTAIDDSGAIQAGLARAWTLQPDGRTYRFRLRTGITFHDGTALTAADVERAWTDGLRSERAATSAQTHPWMLDAIDGADAFAAGQAPRVAGLTVVNDSVIEVRLHRPLASFLATLALPQASVTARASTPTTPIGTGPWRWVRGAPRSGDVWLARNDHHWQPPRLDSLVVRTVPDSMLVRAFDAGWIDYASELPMGLQVALSSRPNIGFARSAPAALVRIELNATEPVLHDPRVRQGIVRAIDRRALVREIAHDDGTLAIGPVPPALLGASDSTLVDAPFDPAAARALFHAAAIPPGKVLHLWAPAGEMPEFTLRLGPLLRDYLVAAGLPVTLDFRPNILTSGPWGEGADDDMILTEWYPDFADADTYLGRYRTSPGFVGGFSHPIFDPRMDRLVDASRATTDPVQRLARIREANAAIAADAPDIFLWFHRTLAAYSLRLTGWAASPYPVRFEHVRLFGGR